MDPPSDHRRWSLLSISLLPFCLLACSFSYCLLTDEELCGVWAAGNNCVHFQVAAEEGMSPHAHQNLELF